MADGLWHRAARRLRPAGRRCASARPSSDASAAGTSRGSPSGCRTGLAEHADLDRADAGRAGDARRGRGHARPGDHLSRRRRQLAAGADRADPGHGRRRRGRGGRRPPSAAGSSARAPTARATSRSAPPTTSARRSSPTRPSALGQAARPAGRDPRPGGGRRPWAWACSWPSGAAATTRRASSSCAPAPPARPMPGVGCWP